MKSMRWIILAGLGFVLLGGRLHAQGQEEINPVPQAPYLAQIPDYGHWTVSFKYPSELPPKAGDTKPVEAPAPPVNKIDIIKTGDMMLVTVMSSSGPPKIFYQRGDWIVTVNPQSTQQAQVLIPTPDHLPYPFYTHGFMLMEGMVPGSGNFKGLVKYNHMPAYDYQTKGGEVWIAPDTMLPIAVKSSKAGLIAEYQFLPAPPSPFQIPSGQASLLQKEQEAYKGVGSMR